MGYGKLNEKIFKITKAIFDKFSSIPYPKAVDTVYKNDKFLERIKKLENNIDKAQNSKRP